MSSPTHVLCGDAAVDAFLAADLEGEHFVWREAMVDGPHAPPGADDEERLDLRARHLAREYGTNPVQARLDLGRMERSLARALAGGELTLWFEDDLFCQVHLWYLLWRARDRDGVSVITSRVPLSELSAGDIQQAFADRARLSREKIADGVLLWLAFAGSNPSRLLPMLAPDSGPTPFSSVAVRLHLERFPWTTDGLGRIERTLLRTLELGCDRFGDLFRRTLADEAGYGFGDAQIWAALVRLASADDRPLIIHGADVATALPEGQLRTARFELTAAGHAALRGEVPERYTAHHLGGVDLGAQLWRWDPERARIERG